MRPFRFFFMCSLGIILFFFFARFLVSALLLAAVFSTIFFVARRIKGFFYRMDWDEGYRSRDYYRGRPQLPVWKDDLLLEYPTKEKEYLPDYRVIEVQ